MKLIATRPFISTRHGNVEKDQEITVDDHLADQYLSTGICVRKQDAYETKVVRPVPLESGAVKLSTSSEADPAPKKKTRKRRKKKEK